MWEPGLPAIAVDQSKLMSTDPPLSQASQPTLDLWCRDIPAIKQPSVHREATMNPFEDMRLFCQVMESGSFTAAAEHLGLSKQFVSRRLIQLEERLGVR